MPTLGYLYLVQGKQRPTILKKILKSVNCTQNKVNIQCTVHCSRPQSHTENRKTTDCEKHCRHPAINQKRCPKNPPWVTLTTIWQSLQTLSNQKNTNSHISKHKGNVEKRIADLLLPSPKTEKRKKNLTGIYNKVRQIQNYPTSRRWCAAPKK